MYNPQLDTFIKVAELGSFSKAAEESYITPTAVIKQINHLEQRLGVKLFVRTHQGIVLTDAGRSLYRDSVYITKYCQDSVERARRASQDVSDVVRIGVSPTTPATFFTRLHVNMADAFPGMRFQFVPFDNTPENAREILGHLGQNIDIVAGILDDVITERNNCAATLLTAVPACVAVPLGHPLAKLDSLAPSDLDGQELMMLRRGYMGQMDDIRNYLRREHPTTHIVDIPFYDTEAFNTAENSGRAIVAVQAWEDINPLLRIMPVRWDFALGFGILHAKQPSPTIEKCLDSFKRYFE
ncbi:MAG: LysR family transcriptional regulator [Tractidigestivibacter sp.]|jgi:DNA-binding transcriptional LysR family regulator|uniref:LysR family transcriptional regulator n=1 Tax=Tractidigestivibacter sp. TaxID=2847320 RepID=UPI003D93FC32